MNSPLEIREVRLRGLSVGIVHQGGERARGRPSAPAAFVSSLPRTMPIVIQIR
jgi:hypothetical protein